MTKCAAAWPKATTLAFVCAETTIAAAQAHINNIFMYLEATHLCPKARTGVRVSRSRAGRLS